LDGGFFLDPKNSPTFLFEELWRGKSLVSPIEIRARSSSLEDTILQFVKRPADGSMKRFSFSGIYNDQERLLAADELSSIDSKYVKSWKDILQIFRKVGVNQTNVDEIEATWKQWIEAQKKGNIKGDLIVQPWETKGGFPIKKYAGSKDVFLGGIETEEGKFEAEYFFNNIDFNRSNLDLRFSELKKKWEKDDAKVSDLEKIEAKYHRAYDKTAANQHNCGVFESTFSNVLEMLDVQTEESPSLLEKEEGKILERKISLDIENNFLFKLGNLDPSAYTNICVKYASSLSNWWYHSDIDELEIVLDAFLNEIRFVDDPKNESEILGADILTVFIDGVKAFTNIPIKFLLTIVPGLRKVIIKYVSGKEKTTRDIIKQRIIDTVKKEKSKENDEVIPE